MFSRRTQFFTDCSVSLFHESSCGHPFLNGYGNFYCSHELRIYNVFDRYLKGIELIRNSSCSHPFDEWLFFHYNKTTAATYSFRFTRCFCRTRAVVRSIIVTNYDTSLVSGMYILKEVFYFTTWIVAIHLFCGSLIISRQHLKRFIMSRALCLFHNIYCNHLL